MNIRQGLDPFIRCFYVCGLSCYPSFGEFLTTKTRNKQLIKYIPTVTLFTITVATSITTCIYKYVQDLSVEWGHSTFFINTSTLIFTVLVCVIQTAFLPRYFAAICWQLSIIERISWRTIRFDMIAFRRHFMRRVVITLISFAIPIVLKMYLKPWTLSSFSVTIGLAILRALMFMILLQAFFYVDLLDHMLQCFVHHVSLRAATATTTVARTVTFRSPAAKQLKADILHFKVLHFNLWEISEKINNLFGWTIFMIFLQHLIYASYNVYMAYFLITHQGDYHTNLIACLRECVKEVRQRALHYSHFLRRSDLQLMELRLFDCELHGCLLSLQ